jgi:phosphoadenosine phosphosulfate reductase
MVHELRPSTEIIFLDTRGHFDETLEFAARVEKEWSLNLTRTTPGPEADDWPCGSERCCELRKVEPLKKAVAGRAAWITSVKRVDAPSRAGMKTLLWDEKFALVKVNPLATWSDDDVAYYVSANQLAQHPLWAQGYASIGCAAVTSKPQVPGDRRSGRWVGADKEECGLHEE